MNSVNTRTETVEINAELIAQLIEPMLYQLGYVKNNEDIVKTDIPDILKHNFQIEYTAKKHIPKEVQTIVING